MTKRTADNCALKAGKRRPAERAVSDEKGKDDADKERTSKEEEDYNNNEEEDCAAAAAAAAPAAATAAATTGRHTSFTATASDQAVAAVAAAWHSGLRQCTVTISTHGYLQLVT